MTSSNLRVLHITNWYPNPIDPIDAQFVKDQIDALRLYANCDVVHIQVRTGRFKWLTYRNSDSERGFILVVPFKASLLKEIMTSFLLCCFWIKIRKREYDIINFHIAYPMLTYFVFFSRKFRVPMVVTEHWSAYRNNFGVKKELGRVKRIFRHQKKWITVSKSLSQDIISFSGQNDLRFSILPNVLSHVFENLAPVETGRKIGNNFFMLSCWQPPKQPIVVLKALAILKSDGLNFNLRIGGYGILEQSIKQTVVDLGLQDSVSYIGKLAYASVVEELKNTDFFLHASDYETFSVVCLESLWQGVPVVASRVGGIPEFVNNTNGVLVDSNTPENWAAAIKSLPGSFDRQSFQKDVREKFCKETIGKTYEKILREYLN